MKKYLCVILTMLIALALRLYPHLLSGLPFSTDAWSPIRNAELLMEHTPIHLENEVFDGYNNYWPANSLFGAVISETTSLKPIQAMAIFIPITGALAILIFYTLTKKLFNAKISFMASIIFGTAFTHTFFTAGVTKETYANPLYLLLILIFLHPNMDKQKQVLLFTITSATLALTHHLTPVIAIAILSSIALARLIGDTKKGLAPNKSDFALVSILIAATGLYFGLYAYKGFIFSVSYSEWLSAVSYQILTFVLVICFMSKPCVYAQTRTLIACSVAIAIGSLSTLLTMKTQITAGFPMVPKHYLLYNSPYIITLPLITLGYGYQRYRKEPVVPLFWLATLVGLEAYAVFGGSSLSLALASRNLNFLHPPLAILSAAGLYRLYGMAKNPRSQKFMKLAVMAIILVIATLNTYSLYAAVSLEERYMGYHWLYRTQEHEAGAWIATATSNPTVAGDMKVWHLMRDYFSAKVDVLQGFRYLTGSSQSQPQILFIYGQMLKNGYVLGLHGVDLPEGWMEKASQLNLIYSNGLVGLYRGEET